MELNPRGAVFAAHSNGHHSPNTELRGLMTDTLRHHGERHAQFGYLLSRRSQSLHACRSRGCARPASGSAMLGLGRQDADSVRGGEFGETGWIGRDGIRQPKIGGGLAGCRNELVEPAR